MPHRSPKNPDDSGRPRRRRLEPIVDGRARGERAEAVAERRRRWWDRNGGSVVAIVLALLSFGVILLLLELVGGG